MKLQHLAILFVLIILPISLIMSAYISNQIEAIEIQTAYNKNLISATYDAVMAFQINTTNNKYSSISDSKIRDVEAAVSTFYNSLSLSMREYAQTASDLEAFTPAILFTLYDGYYIYTSYDNVYSIDEDEKVLINIDGNNYQSGLKPYVYYSAKYRLRNGNIIVVNYTLDNEITVYGDFGGNVGYVTKSGYLINPDLVTNIDTDAKTLTYDGVEIGPEVLVEHLMTLEETQDDITTEEQESGIITKADDYIYIFYQNEKIYQDHDDNGNLLYYDENGNMTTDRSRTGIPVIFWYDNYIKTYVNDQSIRNYARDCDMLSTSAFDYYYEAREFSLWVRDNLGNLEQSDTLRSEDGTTPIGDDNTYLSQNTGDAKIFYADENNDPMLSGSTFNSHRLAVIRKSIETTLNTVISNFRSITLYDYAMPVMSESDWYRILNNVSMVTFMQGMSIGYRDYNNYAIITNNINKEVVTAENIYIVAKEEGTNNREYHQPGCKELLEGLDSGRLTIVGAYPTASFQRQTVRIDENNEEHFYLQACRGDTLTGCYNCIVNATGDYDTNDIIAGNPLIDFTNSIENGGDGTVSFSTNNSGYQDLRKSYLTALARERYDLYKSNFDLSDLG